MDYHKKDQKRKCDLHVLIGTGLEGETILVMAGFAAHQGHLSLPGVIAAAFTGSLIAQFNKTYARAGSFWTAAPSNPTPFGLFSNAPTYERPGAAYIALWQILGTARFTKALHQIQRHYGGSHITEAQLEEAGIALDPPGRAAA